MQILLRIGARLSDHGLISRPRRYEIQMLSNGRHTLEFFQDVFRNLECRRRNTFFSADNTDDEIKTTLMDVDYLHFEILIA